MINMIGAIFQCGGNNLLFIIILHLYVLMVKSVVICSELKVVFGNVSQKLEKDR